MSPLSSLPLTIQPHVPRSFAIALLGVGAFAVACSGGGDDEEATPVPQPTAAATQASATPDVVTIVATIETSAGAPTPVIETSPLPTTAPRPTATPGPVPASTAAPSPSATPPAEPTATPAPTATPVPPTPTNTPVPTPTQDPFENHFLAFDAPEFFDDVSESPTYTIIGRTRVDAFVTVNDTIVDIDEDGRFSLEIQLEEGINIVEVVASVSDAEALDEVLTIIYAP